MLELAWASFEGRECLCSRGWSDTDLAELRTIPAAELGRRLAVLPSEMRQAGIALQGLAPMAGRFEVSDDAVAFVPRFPFLDGTSYSLIVTPNEGGREVWAIERPVRASLPDTSVVAIYPGADTVPVNLLKVYVYFSGTMSEGWAGRAVQVRRADNAQPLEGVFLPMEPELWDSRRQRLTLLLDPGRIKRGLAPHEGAGYPLMEGIDVVVSVETAFRDGAGRLLRSGAERRYRVEPALRARVDPAAWRLHAVTAGSREVLTVEFDRPLDHALLARGLSVVSAAGMPVEGRGSAAPGEQCWQFTPLAAWEEGRYTLVVEPWLEDLAGNSCMRVFDRDLTRAADVPAGYGQVTVEFAPVSPDNPSAAR